MKKLFASSLVLLSLSASAANLEFDVLTESQVKKVGNEFAVDFSHTAVAAPETEGLWGIEVGLVGGQTSSPELSKVVDTANGDGKNFKNLYHAGAMARAHFPFDLFLELTVLPSQTISDVEVKNRSFGLGWNFGEFFGLPLDLAVGANFSNADVSFTQDIQNSSTGNVPVNSTIKLNSKTRVFYAAVSKRFAFFTPYAKIGVARSESEVNVDATTGTIFSYSSSQSDKVSTSGGYAAVGANLSFFFFRLGLEGSQTNNVKRGSFKLSVDF